MKSKTNRTYVATALLCITSSAHAATTYQLNLINGGGSILNATESVLSAAHINDGLPSSVNNWSNYSIDAAPVGATQLNQAAGANNFLVEGSTGILSTTVSFTYSEGINNINFANGFTAGGFNGAEDTLNPGDAGINGNSLYTQLWFTRTGDTGHAFQFSGLEAGIYDVYVYATESNNINRAYNVTFQADSDNISSQIDGISNGISTGNNNTAFVDGLNYTKQTLAVDADENLAIFVSATQLGSTSFSTVGAIQIVGVVPEPSSTLLFGLGALGIATRRRRP